MISAKTPKSTIKKLPVNGKGSSKPIQDEVIEEGTIEIYGAREHNLQGIDLVLPRNKLIVFTGLSGSGKSSLAFDTIYAEGQRRYMETFSAYARQFMGHLQRPDVDKINGLSPVISIEQKTVSRNPRSTVGTITEIYDFLRLLFARSSDAYSYVTGKKMVKFSDEQILDIILDQFKDRSVQLLAPLVKRRKGHYRELFEVLFKAGNTKVRVDGVVQDIVPKMQLSRYQIHDVELVVDRVKITEESKQRIRASINQAMRQGKGSISVLDPETNVQRFFSRNLMCLDSGISYDEPQPNSFSFNSPYGWCPKCKGLGFSYQFEMNDIFPDKTLSIKQGAIAPWGKDIDYWNACKLKAVLAKHGYKGTEPIGSLSEDCINEILFGSEDKIKVDYNYTEVSVDNDGIIEYFQNVLISSGSDALKESLSEIGHLADCPECNGYRLKKEALYFKVGEKNIGEVSVMQLDHFYEWVQEQFRTLDEKSKLVAGEILKEIDTRTKFLLDVGLE